MPGATPVYAIPYPCAGENIDCTVFESFTEAIQDAVDSVRVVETQALNRPAARATATSTQAGFVANTPANLIFQVEDYDNDSMINLGVDNAAVTITTAGWYLFATSCNSTVQATITSLALALSHNGTVIYRHKYSPAAANAVAPGLQVIGLINCAAADVIRSVFLYTGGATVPNVTNATIHGYLVSQA